MAFNKSDRQVNKNCQYDASNKIGDSNTKRLSLFWPNVYVFFRLVQSILTSTARQITCANKIRRQLIFNSS